ncbi:MAG: hypothetical protein LBD14_01540 [Puniceicoccales bacterium]|jgi:hypothetical protein|nr:hypothetical protein [Puniceicoccales bacterium]
MSKIGTANFNGRLTNYAAGLSRHALASAATWLFPRVVTGVAHGRYKRYSGRNAMQVLDTARALGGPAAMVAMAADDPYFNCAPNALDIPIDDAEREAAGDIPGAVEALEEAKVSTLISVAELSRDIKAQEKIDALAPEPGVGVWSNAATDPIAEIDTVLAAIATRTGVPPNRLFIGLSAWLILRNHPLTKGRFTAISAGISTDQLKSILAFPVDVKVGIVSKDTARFGAEANPVNVYGAKVVAFIGNDTPNTYDPSFGKTFTTREGSIEGVYTYRSNNNRSDIYAINWSEDMQVVYPEAAGVIALS